MKNVAAVVANVIAKKTMNVAIKKSKKIKTIKNNFEHMKIQVLGSGCQTCKKLHELTQQAAVELGLNDKVEYVSGAEGIQKIIEIGAMNSPVLAINDKPAMVGFVPNIEKIKSLLKSST